MQFLLFPLKKNKFLITNTFHLNHKKFLHGQNKIKILLFLKINYLFLQKINTNHLKQIKQNH
jgi:hypothetical protein